MSGLVLVAARSWIGTPYRHQCSVRGQGADCLGLLRGVWREVLGAEPEDMPAYTPDWSEASGLERMWEGAARHLLAAPRDFEAAGEVVLFRMRRAAVAKHVAILGDLSRGYQTIIHAYSGAGVVETPLSDAWARRIVVQFRFPDKRD